MSVQTGIFRIDGMPVRREDVTHLLAGLQGRGPDYCAVFSDGEIGIGFRGLHLSPEDKDDQPVQSICGAVLTFDGRLDNRSEIGMLTSVPRVADVTDAQLVLHAFV